MTVQAAATRLDPLKLLAVCRSGNVRSITLARLLRKRGHEAIGVGLKQKTLLPLLYEWAETVYPMDEEIQETLEARGMGYKLDTSFVIGPDDWKIPDHPDLLRRLRDLVEQFPPPPGG